MRLCQGEERQAPPAPGKLHLLALHFAFGHHAVFNELHWLTLMRRSCKHLRGKAQSEKEEGREDTEKWNEMIWKKAPLDLRKNKQQTNKNHVRSGSFYLDLRMFLHITIKMKLGCISATPRLLPFIQNPKPQLISAEATRPWLLSFSVLFSTKQNKE